MWKTYSLTLQSSWWGKRPEKPLKRSKGGVKVIKWILEDSHFIQLRSQGKLPGGVIFKFGSGRQTLKDLQHLQGSVYTRARECGLFWQLHLVCPLPREECVRTRLGKTSCTSQGGELYIEGREPL